MKARLRQPLLWIVVAEVLVMFALLAVSWRVYESHRTATMGAAAQPAPPAEEATSDPPRPQPVASPVRATPRPGAGPSPGAKPTPRPSAAPSGFPVDLGQLNRGQAELEKIEEAGLARLLDAMRAYLERVVLPSVRRAERVSSATSAAAAQSPAAIRKMP